MTDWLQTFMQWTDGIPTPEHFRLWSGIAALAGTMERRLWAATARGAVFPNLYVTLAASPSIGKTEAIRPVEDLWYAAKHLHVSPDSMTSASLLDCLLEADRKIFVKGRLTYEYHALVIPADEFSVLINAFDKEFLGRLCAIWDNRRVLRVRRKYIKEEINIIHPQITILAGVQPGFLNSILPEEAWSMGFPARLCMIYADSGPIVDLFQERTGLTEMRSTLVRGLMNIMEAHGPFQWQPKAQIALSAWHRAGLPPVPDHERLIGYNGKRITTIIKLTMVALASRNLCSDLEIRLEDYERAREWMLNMEATMPEVFRNVVSTTDQQLINELYHYVWRDYIKTKRPMSIARIWAFLSSRIRQVDKIPKIIEAMVKSDLLIHHVGMECYTPKPRGFSLDDI